jgi:hypothetical protein
MANSLSHQRIGIIEVCERKKQEDDLRFGTTGDYTFTGWISNDHYLALVEKAKQQQDVELALQYANGTDDAIAVTIELAGITHDVESDGTQLVNVHVKLLRKYQSVGN